MVGTRFVVNLKVSKASLQIELGFWERLGSFSRNREIQLSEIASVECVQDVKMSIFGFRMIGTGMPKVVVLGHYRKDKKKMMVYWVRGQQALILDLKSGPYQRMIIGCSDAKAKAQELNSYLPV